jgi:phage terminase large subunit-like protein
MVRHVLDSLRQGLPIIEVRATRGKHVRAEPISALYSLGRVSHVGTFETLEDQMCQMTADGYQGDGSPDHVDALVWAFTELFPAMTTQHSEPVLVPRFHSAGGWMG